MATQRRRQPIEVERDAEATVELGIEGHDAGDVTPEGYRPVTLHTSRGDVEMRHYPPAAAVESTSAAIFVGGAGGGWDTPVRGFLYPRLSEELSRSDGMHALRVRYRHPCDLLESVCDVLAGLHFLSHELGVRRVGLVGHSFGGAVVIQAAALAADVVRTCVPLSTQSYGADPAAALGPGCSLLLAHGTADEILPHRCSEHVFAIAKEPKKLLLKDGARHGLDEWADELPSIVREWLKTELADR
jgi:fermentation-respiration switch protein FrsA (DUF1100 family)